MKIERVYESRNFKVRMTIESKNVEGHGVLSDRREATDIEMDETIRNYGLMYEGLFEKKWRATHLTST